MPLVCQALRRLVPAVATGTTGYAVHLHPTVFRVAREEVYALAAGFVGTRLTTSMRRMLRIHAAVTGAAVLGYGVARFLLARWREPPSTLTPPPISRMPTELMLDVLGRLPLEASFSFAMTSRSHYARYFPKILIRGQQFRRAQFAFVELLSRDLPHLAYCEECRALCPRRRGGFHRGGTFCCEPDCSHMIGLRRSMALVNKP